MFERTLHDECFPLTPPTLIEQALYTRDEYTDKVRCVESDGVDTPITQ
jgi:hypothetical protein